MNKTLPIATFSIATFFLATSLPTQANPALSLLTQQAVAQATFVATQNNQKSNTTDNNQNCKEKLYMGHQPQVNANITGQEYATALAKRSFFLCETGYYVQYDPMSKNPLWVAEKLTKAEQDRPSESRTEDFRPHPNVPKNAQATLADFRNSGFDRGHMAPAADMKYGGTSISESFYLTNMVPQVGPNMNRGIWADLEAYARNISKKYGDTYIFTGSIHIDPNNPQSTNILFKNREAMQSSYKIGNSNVFVPTHLYKIIYNPQQNILNTYVIPNFQIVTSKTKQLNKGNFKYPQTMAENAINCGSVCSIDNFKTSLEELERLTGFKFFN